MLFSNQTEFLARKYGLVRAVEMMIEAGYPAIDITMWDTKACPFTDNYREVAAVLNGIAARTGVKFVQAHAPFGNYDRYVNEIIPLLPRAFGFCKLKKRINIICL